MNIDVGPYSFSPTDARRTLAHIDDLIDFLPDPAQPALDGLRDELNRRAEIDSTDDAAVADAVRAVFPRLLDARTVVADTGGLPATTVGTVAQLNVSDGGVPKTPVDRIEVDYGGVTTDRQATRVHHGRPWQALCLWSSETIGALAAAGHPIFPGAAGENITVAGIDWASVTGGARLRIGTVLTQIVAPAVPCKQNAQWFADGDFARIHHRNGPISRLYAVVLEPGVIATGDAATLEP